MADTGILDRLFYAVPAQIEDATFDNFKQAWKYYGIARVQVVRLDPIRYNPRVLQNEMLLDDEVIGAEFYRLYMQDLFRSLLGTSDDTGLHVHVHV